MTQAEFEQAAARLAEEDKRGAPYVVPSWDAGGTQIPVDYAMALAVARSAHPSRVLAVTNVYRYGRFAERGSGVVTVTLMGNVIAIFRPGAVQLFSCGYRTRTTAEALGNLVTGGYFYHDKGVLMFSAYETTGSHRTGTRAVDGTSYPYKRT
jgi:hypothetical protein